MVHDGPGTRHPWADRSHAATEQRPPLPNARPRLGAPRLVGIGSPPAVYMWARKPPSTASTWPVMYDALGDARNTTAPEISAGSPQRPSEVRVFSHSLTPGLATTAALVAVAKKPGATALTVIPVEPNSAANAFVKASRPPFAAV